MGNRILTYLFLFVFLSSASFAGNYYYKNQKINPIPANTRIKKITNDQLRDVVFYNQQRFETLNSKLIVLEKENEELKRDMKQLKLDLKRFKNLYFRRY